MFFIFSITYLINSFFAIPEVNAAPPANQLSDEPYIRVGLYDTTDTVKVKCNKKAKIVKKNGKIIKWVKKNKTIKIKYKPNKQRYELKVGKFYKLKKSYLKIIPKKPATAICQIINYDNAPDWNPDLNDNKFRERIEVQYSENSDKTWIINELGLEHYIQGIGESGNNNDKAYLKSLLTAARTYAAYHYLYPTKHADEPYLLDTTGNDQVYIGYSFEERAPNVVQAAKDTAGRVVTYQNEIVVSPYFSHSDGRTRAWSEVWAGEKEYLLSKDDPGCEGMTLWGHGVGMSAEGARYFAEQENWTWKQILKYYYTGIKIKRAYPENK
ncbi:MAG: SpoIID/LytB domain-containing protein [Patescibacteria group bacterium]